MNRHQQDLEAPENISPKDLPIGTYFAATMWSVDHSKRASGKLYLLPPKHQAYDGIFELDRPELLEVMSKCGAMISTGNFQRQQLRIVASCASAQDPHIYFSWA
jgi:hypothetical protein